MIRKVVRFGFVLAVSLVLVLTNTAYGQVEPSQFDSGFTYQGRLEDNEEAANGIYDFRFILYDAYESGNQVGPLLELGDVMVTNGYFSVNLDFGDVFSGQALWLVVAVRPGDSSESYTTLTPRQALTGTPYSFYAQHTPWEGVTSIPVGFSDGVDDNTTYSAGIGLNLEETTFNADTTYLQRRVSSACAVGSTIRAINSDGTVVCGTIMVEAPVGHPLQSVANSISILDNISPVIAAADISIGIGVERMPVISYYDSTNGDLKVAHCTDTICSSADITTVDSPGDVGSYSSITIGADGLPVISYYDSSNGDLKVAHCADTACTSAENTITTLDSGGDVGRSASIIIGTDGLPVINYIDSTNGDLKLAHCTDIACTSATLSTLANSGIQYSAIAIGADGLPVISYYDSTYSNLKVAHCVDTTCSNADITNLNYFLMGAAQAISITIGADGLPFISFYDAGASNLVVAHCVDTSCSNATFTSIGSLLSSNSLRIAITIGVDGLPIIVYSLPDIDTIGVVHCTTMECTRFTQYQLESNESRGTDISVTIGADGLPIISFIDHISGNLKVAHCANELCVPYFRRK